MATTEDTNENKRVKALRENSLRIAGIGQWIGDAALMGYGALMNNFKVGSVGALGVAAGGIGMRYGNPSDDKQLQLVERKLGDYFQSQGIKIPKDPTLDKLTNEGGIIDHVESFLYSHPAELMNVCFGLMGTQFLRSGYQNKEKSLMAGGAMLVSAALIGLLVKEEKPDPDHPPVGAVQKAISWIQEKPLRVTGSLMNINAAMLAYNGWQERKTSGGSKNYMLKLLAAAGFGLCNTMLMISSKGDGGGAIMEESHRNELAETTARVIAAQPRDVQDKLIEQVSGYLAVQPYVGMKADDISRMMHQKIDTVRGTFPVMTGLPQR